MATQQTWKEQKIKASLVNSVEQVPRHAFANIELQVRVTVAQLWKDVRQEIRAQGMQDADPDRPAQ